MKRPIRVLHIITKLSFGGVQSVLMNYYRYIDRKRIQFDFVVQSDDKHFFEKEVLSLGGNIYRLPSINTDRKKFELELFKLLQAHPEYQIVHAHQNFTNIIPLRIAKKAKVKVRISHSHSKYVARTITKESMRKIFRLVISYYATNYFSCSQASAVWLYGKKNSSSNKCKIIHNAIDSNIFIMDSKIRKKIRKNLSIENKFVIIHIGMFGEAKNHEFLLEIFKEFHNKYNNSVLMLIGDGNKRNNLLNLTSTYGIDEDVLFLGKKDNVNQYLMAADYFILPSINEGLPVVVVEAQASGLPCLVSEAVSNEVDITGIVRWCSIKRSPTEWANLIDTQSKRVLTQQKVIEGQYDIKYESEKLANIYEKEIHCNG